MMDVGQICSIIDCIGHLSFGFGKDFLDFVYCYRFQECCVSYDIKAAMDKQSEVENLLACYTLSLDRFFSALMYELYMLIVILM